MRILQVCAEIFPLLKTGGLADVATCGFRDVIINHSHLGEQIVDALGDGTQFDLVTQRSRSPVRVDVIDFFRCNTRARHSSLHGAITAVAVFRWGRHVIRVT